MGPPLKSSGIQDDVTNRLCGAQDLEVQEDLAPQSRLWNQVVPKSLRSHPEAPKAQFPMTCNEFCYRKL